MALTMTEEQEREMRVDTAQFRDADRVSHDSFVRAPRQREALLRELDATRAELARLRAELPSEGERKLLGRLRGLTPWQRLSVRVDLTRMARLFASYAPGRAVYDAIAALLAPEGEVSR